MAGWDITWKPRGRCRGRPGRRRPQGGRAHLQPRPRRDAGHRSRCADRPGGVGAFVVMPRGPSYCVVGAAFRAWRRPGCAAQWVPTPPSPFSTRPTGSAESCGPNGSAATDGHRRQKRSWPAGPRCPTARRPRPGRAANLPDGRQAADLRRRAAASAAGRDGQRYPQRRRPDDGIWWTRRRWRTGAEPSCLLSWHAGADPTRSVTSSRTGSARAGGGWPARWIRCSRGVRRVRPPASVCVSAVPTVAAAPDRGAPNPTEAMRAVFTARSRRSGVQGGRRRLPGGAGCAGGPERAALAGHRGGGTPARRRRLERSTTTKAPAGPPTG